MFSKDYQPQPFHSVFNIYSKVLENQNVLNFFLKLLYGILNDQYKMEGKTNFFWEK